VKAEERSRIGEKEIQELLHELAQCREDERATKSQIFQVITVAFTFLAILFAASEYASASGKYEVLPEFSFYLTIIMVCALLAYITNAGVLTTFRHHHAAHLERLLDSKIPLSEITNKKLISLNWKKYYGMPNLLYKINYLVVFVAVLLLAVFYIAVQFRGLNHTPLSIFALICFLVVVLLTVFSVFFSTQKMERIYGEPIDPRYKPRVAVLEVIKGVLYYIYPRPKDFQKIFFLVLGIVLGYLGLSMCGIGVSLDEKINMSVITVLILDVLVYQSRYQINDLRGLSEDKNHPMHKQRMRLPIGVFGDRTASALSCATILIKILGAVVLIAVTGGDSKVPLFVCSVLIYLLAIAYEYSRKNRRPKLTLALVCWGYPLRIFAGMWVICPTLFSDFRNVPRLLSVIILILAATALFGESFVAQTWALEAASYHKEGKEIPKEHLKYLSKQIADNEIMADLPLQKRGKLNALWNHTYVLSMLILGIAIAVFNNWNIDFLRVSAILLSIAAIAAYFAGARRALLFVPLILLTGYHTFLAIRGSVNNVSYINVILGLMALCYSAFYISFRNTNYDGLYGFLSDAVKKVQGWIIAFLILCLKIIYSKETWETLYPK